MSECTDFVANISYKITETKDDFICKTVMDFLGCTEELDDIILSKELLIRAVVCFKEDHPLEYQRLIKESVERCTTKLINKPKYGDDENDN